MDDITTNGLGQVPEIMTEEEVIQFLRIPEVSASKNFHNVIINLVRNRDMPRIYISQHRLYPRKAILEWIEKQTDWR